MVLLAMVIYLTGRQLDWFSGRAAESLSLARSVGDARRGSSR